MDDAEAQQEIDSILKVLKEARQYSGLGPNDPSVIALEEIMLAKVAVLEAAKLASVTLTDAVAAQSANQQAPSPEPLPLLSATEEEPSEGPPKARHVPE